MILGVVQLRIVQKLLQKPEFLPLEILLFSLKLMENNFLMGHLLMIQLTLRRNTKILCFFFFEISSFDIDKFYNIRFNFFLIPSLKAFPSDQQNQMLERARRLCEGVPFVDFVHYPAAKIIHKKFLNAILATAGGCRKFQQMEEVIKSRDVQIISLSRPLICEPDLNRKFVKRISNSAKCINCRTCMLKLSEPLRYYDFD
jgi:hypothetical protein